MMNKPYLFVLIVLLASTSCALNNKDLLFQSQEAQKQEQTVQRQVIYTGNMSMTVADQDSATAKVLDIVSQDGGLLFQREGYQFTFKLDPEKLEPTMHSLASWET